MAKKLILCVVTVLIGVAGYAYLAHEKTISVMDTETAAEVTKAATQKLPRELGQVDNFSGTDGGESYPKQVAIEDSEFEQVGGSKVVRHIGERLDPETYIGEGAPELVVIGERLDPDRVYPNSGAEELRVVGEKITDVENHMSEGAKEFRLIGERIPASQVR